PAESVEQRTGPLGIGRRGAKEADELALAGGAGGAPDRALDEGGPLGPYRSGKRDLGGRLHRAHFDEELSLDLARQQAGGTAIDRRDGGGVGEDADDGFARAREFSGR